MTIRAALTWVVLLAGAAASCAGGSAGDGTGATTSSGAGGSGGAVPSCSDATTNGSETDVDCGGEQCPDCDDGRACGTGTDCLSGFCGNGTCQPPACDDGVSNGTESGTDCGGQCPACEVCWQCAVDADCETGLCQDGLCAPTITVVNAVYAANCGAATPVPSIGAACNFQQSCNYLFNYTVDIGFDPAYGCYKDLTVEYTCSGSMTTKTFYEACAPCDPQNTPTMITLDLFCDPCLGLGEPPA